MWSIGCVFIMVSAEVLKLGRSKFVCPLAVIYLDCLGQLDGVAREIARRMLREIRSAANVSPRYLVVLITGESDIVSLVRGPDSEFNCSHEYLVQGCDLELFRESFRRWTERVGLSFGNDDAACTYISELTNGNISLLRRFIHALLENDISSKEAMKEPLAKADIDSIFDRLVSLGPHGATSFQWASELISSEPDCWPLLEELILGAAVQVGPEPTILELSGAAAFKDGSLKFSSPVMKSFLKKQFNAQQMADLYAQAGLWPNAFERYEQTRPPSPRPSSFQDELIVASIVRRLYGVFRTIPWVPLRGFLVRGATGILGFEYGGWWHRDQAGLWSEIEHRLEAPQRRLMLRILDRADLNENGAIIDVDKVGLAVVVPDLAPGSFNACVVGDMLSWAELSWKRSLLLREVFDEFLRAYVEKLRFVHSARWSMLVRNLTEIARSAYAGLFVETASPQDVLRSAAEKLFKSGLGYERVFCTMREDLDSQVMPVVCAYPTDRKLEKVVFPIKGEHLVSHCLDQGPQFARQSDWPAGDSGLVKEHGLSAAIAVPLEGEEGTAEGVLCVTFEPQAPFDEEVRMLSDFAKHLSAALQQSRRVGLLQSALDRLPQPVVLFDKGLRKKYANAPAVQLLAVSPSWSRGPGIGPGSPMLPFRTLIQSSIRSNQRLVDFPDRIGDRAHRSTVVSDALTEPKDNAVIGGILQIQDESYYRQILFAYRSLEESRGEDEALSRLQVIFEQLRHPWLRKYTRRADRLVLDTWIDGGLPVSIPEFELAARAPGQLSWKCIEDGMPVVLKYDPRKKLGERFHTERGLLVIADPDPHEARTLDKKVGDYWIDFPLMRSKEDVFGKITLPCESNLSPERFEMFCVFSEMAGESFKRLRVMDEQRAGAEARDIKTEVTEKIQPLDVTLALYQELSEHETVDGTRLLHATESFKRILVKVRETISSTAPLTGLPESKRAGSNE